MRWIKSCLSKLKASSVKTDVLIIDNNSNDETISFVKKQYSSINIIPLHENLGFGKANNIGLQISLAEKYDFTLLLNQDCYLFTNSIEEMLKFYDKDVGIISPLHLNGDGDSLDGNFYTYLKKDECGNSILMDYLLGKQRNYYDWGFVNAACWLLPSKTLQIIGGFNPLFFHYGEDDDYVHRVLFHGLKIRIVTSSYVQHDRILCRIKPDPMRNHLLRALNINAPYSIKDVIVDDLFRPLTDGKSVKSVLTYLSAKIRLHRDIVTSRKICIQKKASFLQNNL